MGCGSDEGPHDPTSEDPDIVPGPAGVGPGVRVLGGTTVTLGATESCTVEADAAGDRWCGFMGLSSTGTRNLFVVNVTQVIAGTAVSCEAPDPNCLLLTDDVQGRGADGHGTYFVGDTLVYYDASLVPYAWRPGMDGGRRLVSPSDSLDFVLCTPAARGTAVVCLALPDEQPDPTLVVADVYAGRADGASDPPLVLFDSVIGGNQADQGVRRFSCGFPSDGYVAWTSRPTADGLETLKLASVDDPASTTTIAEDVHAWDTSPDGSRWFWLSAIDERGTGVLQTAPFPDGAYPSDVLPGVADYGLHRDGSPVARTFGADVVSIADPLGAPETHVLIDRNVQTIVELSDHAYVAYAKHFVGTKTTDLFVSRLDGTAGCTLDTTVSVPLSSVVFSPGVEAVLWALSKAGTYDAFSTRLSDCSTVAVSPDVMVLTWIGHRTALFMDDFDADNARGSLRVRTVTRDGRLTSTPPLLIAEDVDTYAVAGGTLLYTVNGGGDQDGVYVRAFGN